MTGYTKVALCVAAFAFAAPSSAAVVTTFGPSTVTYSDSAVVANLPKFDSRFGILQSVTINNVYRNNFYYSFTGGPNSSPPILNVVGYLGDTWTGRVDVNQQVQTRFVGDDRVVGFSLVTQAQNFFNGDLSAYLGAGVLTFAAYPNVTTGLVPAPVSFPSGFSQFSITYAFASAIPEPATWAMMLTGFALTGYALRRRRARVAFA